jgi:2-desacetyl-2-hydroxyethyl bacteriochlorophyllide A dehydrogenase
MKSLTLERPRRLVLREEPPPGAPGPDEALVRFRRVGLCSSDFQAFRGANPLVTFPRVLGHELGAEVLEAAPNAEGLEAGDRCAVEPYVACGRCVACRRGRTSCCVDLEVLGLQRHGGLREMAVMPLSKLHRSWSLSFDQLALVETLAAGAHAVERARPEAGEWALVVGAGPLGLSVAHLAQAAGARVVVTDLRKERLALCRRHLRPEATLPAPDATPDRLREIMAGELPTLLFDATGARASMVRSFDLVAHGGRLVLAGQGQGLVAFSASELHRRELTVLASRHAVAAEFRRAVALAEAGWPDAGEWITHRARLDGLKEALPRWAQPESGVFKAVVEV